MGPEVVRWRVARWLPAIVWAGVIFGASSIPGKDIPGGYSVYGHLAEYAIFGVLLYLAARGRWDRRRAALFAVLVASAYGVTDELHQFLTPGRTPDPVDWLTDTLGAAVAVGIALLYASVVSRSKPRSGSNDG